MNFRIKSALSFNPITNCKSRLTEPTLTDFWNTLTKVLEVKNKGEYPHVQASAHPPTYTPVTSFLRGWITHSSATKTSYPAKERRKLVVKAAFQRSQKSWFFGNWAVGQPQRSDNKDIGMRP